MKYVAITAKGKTTVTRMLQVTFVAFLIRAVYTILGIVYAATLLLQSIVDTVHIPYALVGCAGLLGLQEVSQLTRYRVREIIASVPALIDNGDLKEE